jgi:hypothetical protein
MKIIFHFNIIILKKEYLHVYLCRFYKMDCKYIKYWTFSIFKLMEPKKILVYYQIMHVIII